MSKQQEHTEKKYICALSNGHFNVYFDSLYEPDYDKHDALHESVKIGKMLNSYDQLADENKRMKEALQSIHALVGTEVIGLPVETGFGGGDSVFKRLGRIGNMTQAALTLAKGE